MTGQESTPAAPHHHRRSREEVEALAKNFVATPVEDGAPQKSRTAMIGGIAGAAVLVSVIVYFALPSRADTGRNADAARAAAAAEVEQLRQRMEAERERNRKELAAGQDYLDRIGAADAALLKDLSDQADKLADRQTVAASSAPASAEAPTPRDESRAAATTTIASAAPATAPSSQKSAPAPQQVAAQPAATQPAQSAPAQARPTEVAQAAKSECSIHVSELSKSGKMTYESIKKVKGVRIDEPTGHVFTPPVKTSGGRTVVFEVMPDGCVRVARR